MAQKAKKLVIDSNAFIKGLKLENIGSEFYTIPQVVNEVRDVKAREFLANFPFKINTRDPPPAALKAISDFARKTGDYAFLSPVDLRVLALTYTLEVEAKKTTAHLRKEPLKLGTEINQAAPNAINNNNNNNSNNDNNTTSNTDNTNDSKSHETTENQESNTKEDNTTENHQEDANKENTAVSENEPSPSNDAEAATSSQRSEKPQREKDESEDQWITIDNIASVKARHGKEDAVNLEPVEVGCFTTDYAMQSVLLQMGLKLLSVDGLVIRKIRQYVFKCQACFKICKDMERKFCPSCGNTTLIRHSVSTDDEGNLTYTLAQKVTTRGKVYPIPLPRGGRNSKDLILTEDTYLEKTKWIKDPRSTDVFGDEYSFAGRKSGPQQRVVVGYGKRNPNVVQRHVGKRNKPFTTA